ncbi:hypothetical protein WME97_36975 [Sorangium sp. So ce367]|uniref:hypothetical protein n=1 Tax=Sorangium sp. So ce367 TaxID=3133305 RepID=UPI003F5FD450
MGTLARAYPPPLHPRCVISPRRRPELWSVRRVVTEERNRDRSVIAFGKVARDVSVDPARMRAPKQG